MARAASAQAAWSNHGAAGRTATPSPEQVSWKAARARRPPVPRADSSSSATAGLTLAVRAKRASTAKSTTLLSSWVARALVHRARAVLAPPALICTPATPGTPPSHQLRAQSAAAASRRPAGHDSASATSTSGSLNAELRRANASATAAGAGGGGGSAAEPRAAPRTAAAWDRPHPLEAELGPGRSAPDAPVMDRSARPARRERPWATRTLATDPDPNERALASTARDRALAAVTAAAGTAAISPRPPLDSAQSKRNPACARRSRSASWNPAPRPSRQRHSSAPTRQLHLPSPARPRLASTTWEWR
jgi:hypothetical protein